MSFKAIVQVLLLITVGSEAFTSFQHGAPMTTAVTRTLTQRRKVRCFLETDNKKGLDKAQKDADAEKEEMLSQTFGGYTVKQRLREEIESPFRNVRLLLFASSAGSALTALYFSTFAAIKANMGGFADAPPLEEALQSCAINLGAAIILGLLAWREWNVGEANLARIARGGALAKLRISPLTSVLESVSMASFRRKSRVLIAAGGANYLNTLARSLNADQLSDTNTLPEALESTDVIVVPVLLQENVFSNNKNKPFMVGDTKTTWLNTQPDDTVDANFDITRANKIIAFPSRTQEWTQYLENEIQTAQSQGFDVLEKGITITVKKNGRILRRATGQPQWGNFISTMEVMDGSKFGMPGDSEKYGGP